jgi:hypothetical protein
LGDRSISRGIWCHANYLRLARSCGIARLSPCG